MKIAILDDYQQVALSMADWSRLGAASLKSFPEHIADPQILSEELRGFDCIVVMRERTPMPRSLLERLPELKLLVTTGARNAAVDVDAATELGIQVCGTRSAVMPTIELTWGLILSLARNIAAEDRNVRAGHWQTSLGEGLDGRTLGILGLGRLGSMVARIGPAFGMRVIAWSQNLNPAHAASVGVVAVGKEEFFRQSDFVSIHLVLSERTKGFVSRPEFAMMKSSAYLVNTSRGPIVDERALEEALMSRTIAGAAIDVFEQEPLPTFSGLRKLENILLSPHKGYVTREAYELYFGDVVDAVAAWQRGERLRPLNDVSLQSARSEEPRHGAG